jgi:hypothetical protein
MGLPRRLRVPALALVGAALVGCGTKENNVDTGGPGPGPGLPAEILDRLKALSPTDFAATPADPTNRFADNPMAAALGKKFFFEKRLS